MKKAIDISYYQKNVDYKRVKESGIEMVILRSRFTGYGIPKSKNKDKLFEEHYRGFKDIGIPIGVYWYSCAYIQEELKKWRNSKKKRLKSNINNRFFVETKPKSLTFNTFYYKVYFIF